MRTSSQTGSGIGKILKKQFVHIPVIRQLRELLYELGYDQYKGTDRYILAPEITENRVENIGDGLSRSFSHYYKQLNTGDVLTFKCLRKTYLSRLKIFLQKNPNQIDVKDISNHSGDAVLDKHYLDKRLIAAAFMEMGFEVFPSRQKELQQLREMKKLNEKGSNGELFRTMPSALVRTYSFVAFFGAPFTCRLYTRKRPAIARKRGI